MKIPEIRQNIPTLERKRAEPAGGSKTEVPRLPANDTEEIDKPGPTTKSAMEPAAVPPLIDFQPSGVRNDFSAKYRRAEMAIEGTIYRLAQMQLALQDPGGDSEGVIAAPGNNLLQHSADELAALAHIESVKFRKGD
jgi:hypothetical protein